MVPAFGIGASSAEGGGVLCVSTAYHRGMVLVLVPEEIRVPAEPFSTFGSWESGSDGSGFQFQLRSWATLTLQSLLVSFGDFLFFFFCIGSAKRETLAFLVVSLASFFSPLGGTRVGGSGHLDNTA